MTAAEVQNKGRMATLMIVYHTETDHGTHFEQREAAAKEMWQATMALARRLDRQRIQTNDDGEEELVFFMQV